MKNIIFLSIFITLSFTSIAQICVGEPGKVQWEIWRGLYADQLSELSALEFYPQSPDIVQTIYSLNAPINYDNNFGAKISGFIHVPVSDSISFNITGNSRAQFYLSSSDSPNNLVLRAFLNEATNEFEYDKFQSQTSNKIYLQSGTFYYFEIRYVESTGGDHCKVFWKNNFISNTTWNVVTASYLNDVGCKIEGCAQRGTPCDDNNANTTEDIEDGHCNCVGKPTTTNPCVTSRNHITRYRYDNVTGSTINDLYLDPNFPAIPTTGSALPLFGVKSESQINNSGNLVQGYLSVPVSGNYKFNVTGDDMAILFISSDDNPENKQAHQVLVSGWTNMTEHNKYIYQSTSNIYLQAGQFYYVELNHKEGTGSEHFGAFWQTPFTQPGVWKRIPSFYFYDFGCTLACIPQGTPCDDGDPFTNNDQYNAECTCVGTPCSGPDCDSPLANYVPYEKCNVTDQLANKPSNNWLSCQINPNPNPIYQDGHWIRYDLGQRHQLISSHIWNYNVMDETHKGFQAVSIDYSDDGNNWTHLDIYNWPLATGETGYGGFNGPDLSGVFARYVLITSMDDPSECRGLGKVAFKAIFCPAAGTICDDKNPSTINDAYDNNCQCMGQHFLVNECDEEFLNLGNVMLNTDVFSAINQVTAVSTIDDESIVSFIAGKAIVMNPGFETEPNALFIATIDTCDTSIPQGQKSMIVSATKKPNFNSQNDLMVIPVQDTDFVDIYFRLRDAGQAKLVLTDNHTTYILADHEYMNKGVYRKRVRTKLISDKLPLVSLISSSVSETIKFPVSIEKD